MISFGERNSSRSSAHGIAAVFARGSRRGRAVRLDSRTWNTYENSERAGNPWSQELWRMQRALPAQWTYNVRTIHARVSVAALSSFLLNCPCRELIDVAFAILNTTLFMSRFPCARYCFDILIARVTYVSQILNKNNKIQRERNLRFWRFVDRCRYCSILKWWV